MNIRKSLIVAAVFMSVSAIAFAQEPASKPAKKEKSKTEKPASDTAKVHSGHKAHKPAAKKAS